MVKLKAAFDKYDEDYLKFDLIEKKLHARPDLCAFLLLDKLLPTDGRYMVSAASHDEIYLDVDCEKLADVATEEDVLMLARCGVRYDSGLDCLAMFV